MFCSSIVEKAEKPKGITTEDGTKKSTDKKHYPKLIDETDNTEVNSISPQVKINKNFECKIVNIFLPISFKILLGYSNEPSH